MGDAIEDLKAVAELEKQRRRESWEQRDVAIAAIRELGYGVQAMGTAEMHFRIKLAPGEGFVDFWPSTWRWHRKHKGQMRPTHSGNGLKAMLEYLNSIPKG